MAFNPSQSLGFPTCLRSILLFLTSFPSLDFLPFFSFTPCEIPEESSFQACGGLGS